MVVPPDYLWIALVVLAALLDIGLVRWARRRWQVDDSARQVRVLGAYSPVLTWLKYRRLPQMRRIARRAPQTLQFDQTAPSAHGGAIIQESVRMSTSEIPVSPAAPAKDPPARLAESEPGPALLVKPEARWGLALALGAFALALIGQFYFSNVREDFRDGVIFFAIAIGLFLLLTRRFELQPGQGFSLAAWLRQAQDRVRNAPLQTTLVVISFALTYTNLRFLRVKPGNEPYWDAFALWVISSLTFAAAFVRWPRLDWAGVRAWAYRNRADLWLAAGLTGAAALFRFWQLGALPNVISGDEGRIGLLAESVIKGEINNMLATLYGHGTLYLFIMAGFMKLFGAGTVGLRITSAAAGTLAVPALYLLGRRLFNVRVACVAAALMAVSHFHLHFSRIIVAGSIQDALWSTLVFYLFLTGLEQKSAGRMTLSGLTLGVYVHVYMGARLLYLLLPVYVACLLIRDRDLVRQNLGNLLAFLGALIAASAPMGLWAYLHPDEFMARANQVGILQSGWLVNEAQVTGKTQLGILVEQLRQAFLTVNYYPATGFYYAKLPMLDFVSGAVFMLGIAYSLYHVFDRRHLLLQGWFWSGVIVGGALVVLPGDAAYRILIIFPAVCLFVALGWDRLAAFASQALASRPARTGAVTALFVAAIAIPNLKAYLLDYAPTCRYEDWGTRYASRMGTIIGRLGPRYAPYLLGAPRIYYGIHPSVDFLSNGVPVTNVNDVLTAPPTALDPRARVVFFIIPERENELAFIQAQLPGGEVQRIYDCTDLQMITYKYDGSPAP